MSDVPVTPESVGCECAQPVHGYTADKAAYLRRLKLVEGQVRGVARMVEENQYCIDVLNQVAAATNALKSVSMELLRDHLEHCLANAIRQGGDEAEEKFDEAMRAIKRIAR